MNSGSEAVPMVGVALMLFFLLIALLIMILMVWVYCRIFSKTGFCWALGLLMFVPIANIIMLFVLAFADWPILRELRQLKQQRT